MTDMTITFLINQPKIHLHFMFCRNIM